MRTLGRRIFPLRPVHGFVAEATTSSLFYLTAFVIAAPISATEVMTASVMGVDATRRIRADRVGRCSRDCDGLGAYAARCRDDRRSRLSPVDTASAELMCFCR
jgi:phosphate/sulfate permease